MTGKSENTAKTHKRTVPKTAWKKGDPSPNPGGRPKNQNSLSYWVKEYGNMTPAAVAELIPMYAAELKKGGDKSTIFAMLAVRWLLSQLNEPDSRLLELLLDRTEGKVSQPIEVYDWRKELAEFGRDPDALVNNLFSKVTAHADGDDTR